MHIINAVNVNDAYRQGIKLVVTEGKDIVSRNGPVRVMNQPVTTRYTHPMQKVLFDPQRDANPFFHVFEALWMLAGRNDLAYLTQFLKSFAAFSDDGVTLHGAYGYRWRHMGSWGPDAGGGLDQLPELAKMLVANPLDRRAILQIWDAKLDLNAPAHRGKDIPCNDLVKFRIVDGRLDMYVFCRSNDTVFGCYGANAVHFAFLQEYMAARIGIDPGVYEQISADFHIYTEQPYKLEKYWPFHEELGRWINPYLEWAYHTYPLVNEMATFDRELEMVTNAVAAEKFQALDLSQYDNTFFVMIAQPLYQAYRLYKGGDPMTAAEYLQAFADSNHRGTVYDWMQAGKEWLLRRATKLSFPNRPVQPTKDAHFSK